ncbi:MAG: hypothetical protein PHC89_00970 [Candidatus Pacebacteria bacterium]|nr:hypothetical protein [Candidatus Paceibacterota bacterium]
MEGTFENAPVFSWESREFDFKKKKNDWFWILGLIALALVIIAILLKNYLFIFFVVIGAFLMGVLGNTKTDDTKVIIGEKGIQIDGDFFLYDKILGFWLARNTLGEIKLLIQTNERINPVHSVLVSDSVELEELYEFLLHHIEERELVEPMANRIINRIQF